MGISKYSPFKPAIILSLVLHVAFVAGVSGVKGFDFDGAVVHRTLIATLVTETSGRPGPPKAGAPKKSISPIGLINLYPATEQRSITSTGPAGNVEGASAQSGTADAAGTEGEEKTLEAGNDEARAADGDDPESPVNDPSVVPAKPALEVLSRGERADRIEPVFVKEKFQYDLYWLGVYVGRASLEAVNDETGLRITSRVHSAPFISTFYKVEDYAESRLVNGAAVHFRIRQQEGRYRSDKETIFDILNERVTYFDYLKGIKNEHAVAKRLLWDVVSGFYFLRTRPLPSGETLLIDIFDSNKFYKAEVNVLGKERVRLPGGGEVEALIVKPDLKSEGLFQNKGDILIWLTDDENRIPVRVETKAPIGKVTAELKSVETE